MKAEQKRKRCPRGTRRNKKTGLCAPKNVAKAKAKAKAKSVTQKTARKRCPRGTRRNRKTGRCERKQVVSVKADVPAAVATLRRDVNRALESGKDYVPKQNRELLRLITQTKRRDLFDCAAPHNKVKIKVKRKNGTYACLDAGSKAGQLQLLKFMNRPRRVECFMAPVQVANNCWFNTMLVSLFVSDRTFWFSRILRLPMITGQRHDGTPLDSWMVQPLRRLNSTIQAAIDCVGDYKYLLDTNVHVRELHRGLNRAMKGHALGNVGKFRAFNEYGNPYRAYLRLSAYLLGENYQNHITNSHERYQPNILRLGFQAKGKYKRPDILQETYHVRGVKYVLDSAAVLDVGKHHFTSCAHINGVQYVFDGASLSKMKKLNWKSLLNKDVSWTFEPDNLLFNFKRSYIELYYCRA